MDKDCFTCKKTKSEKEFNDNKSRKDGKQNKCKDCQREYDKTYYDNNEKRRKNIRKTSNKSILKTRNFIGDYLLKHSCIDCGEKNIIVLEFDHLEDKSFNFADKIMKGISIKTLEKEILKCEIRCANCHRIKTAKDFSYWKYEFLKNKIII